MLEYLFVTECMLLNEISLLSLLHCQLLFVLQENSSLKKCKSFMDAKGLGTIAVPSEFSKLQ